MKKKQIEHLEFTFADTLRFRTPEPKAVIFDIRATTRDHRFLDIEMQRATHSFFTDRVLLYGSFLAIKGKQELDKSPEFLALSETERKEQRYKLPKIIAIWICNFDSKTEHAKYRDSWAIHSENDLSQGILTPVSDKMNYIMVNLPQFTKKRSELQSKEDIWLYLLVHAGEQSEMPNFNDPVVDDALERIRVDSASDALLEEQVKEMVTQDEIDCRLAEGYLRGQELGMAKGMEKGMQKGLEDGMAKGLAKGEQKGKLDVARKMLAGGLPLEKVLEFTGLSEEDVKAL